MNKIKKFYYGIMMEYHNYVLSDLLDAVDRGIVNLKDDYIWHQVTKHYFGWLKYAGKLNPEVTNELLYKHFGDIIGM